MTLPLPVQQPELFDAFIRWICQIPHSRQLGLTFIQGERGRATFMVPYDPKLVGDTRTGVLHGGVITSLMDNTSAASIFSRLDESCGYPTLDLRIDYLRPATPGLPVYCTAECYRITREIAFTQATAYQDESSQPVAYSVGTFMRGASFSNPTGATALRASS